MLLRLTALFVGAPIILAISGVSPDVSFQAPSVLIPKFPMPRGALVLTRSIRPGSFFDVVGRRSAVFGYENKPLEAWVYPLKIVDDFGLSFR
ncbi:MAG: hypothetical protein H0W08_12920, partial [Acidobacteria bacterium]|nr:hypothetical protein [Acidobacteriota bacterium]